MGRPPRSRTSAAPLAGADDLLRQAAELVALNREAAGDGDADLLIAMIEIPRGFIARLASRGE